MGGATLTTLGQFLIVVNKTHKAVGKTMQGAAGRQPAGEFKPGALCPNLTERIFINTTERPGRTTTAAKNLSVTVYHGVLPQKNAICTPGTATIT